VTRGAVLLENRESTIPVRTAPWCSRITRCCPGSRSNDNVRLAVDRSSRAALQRVERDQWTMHNLDLVQMSHAKDKRPAEISGGMKQRVGLARALAMEPKVLLLDEPFGALDALTRAHLQDSVMAIHQKLGNTVLMITHDVDEAVLPPDRIVMMTTVRPPASARCWTCRWRGRVGASNCRERDLPQMPPARARIPLRAPQLRRGGLTLTIVMFVSSCRACRGHPRLAWSKIKTWMAGTSPAMTWRERRVRRRLGSFTTALSPARREHLDEARAAWRRWCRWAIRRARRIRAR